jgi:hypothetical protein
MAGTGGIGFLRFPLTSEGITGKGEGVTESKWVQEKGREEILQNVYEIASNLERRYFG